MDQTMNMNKKGMSGIGVVLLVLLVAVVFAGGTYYYMNNKLKKDKDSLNNQITSLQKEVSDLKAASTASTSTTASETANWKTYNDSANKFSFKYPAEWGSPKLSVLEPSDNPTKVKGYSNNITFPSNAEKSVTVGFSTADFSAPRHSTYWESISKQIGSTCAELEKNNQVIISGSCVANGNNGFITKFDWFGDKPTVGVIFSGISKYPVFTVSPEEVTNQIYADSITRQILNTFQFTK